LYTVKDYNSDTAKTDNNCDSNSGIQPDAEKIDSKEFVEKQPRMIKYDIQKHCLVLANVNL
jgi:hypothetical protein